MIPLKKLIDQIISTNVKEQFHFGCPHGTKFVSKLFYILDLDPTKTLGSGTATLLLRPHHLLCNYAERCSLTIEPMVLR